MADAHECSAVAASLSTAKFAVLAPHGGLGHDAPRTPPVHVPCSTVAAPSTRTVLQALSKTRLLELARIFSVAVPTSATKEAQAEALAASGTIRFRELLGALGRDELKAACRSHGLDDAGRARPLLASRLLQAHGATESAPPKSIFTANRIPRYAPRPGDIVQVRHRQWLVEDVVAPPAEGHATLVKLVCLDDDNQGRPLEVLWELELGAKVHQPEAHGLGDAARVDPPRHFAAYLHALKWNCVTATDAKLFQSPFRAGIKLMDHQLTPLQKALSLPRANVFIADDVGLGKTIEAGLIAQELLLRQRVEFMLVVCPASVCLQWREEMEKRFGLHFEVMNRAFIGRRRQERGFGVNPWSTHTRFIVSHRPSADRSIETRSSSTSATVRRRASSSSTRPTSPLPRARAGTPSTRRSPASSATSPRDSRTASS